jgi:hypothetical protein
MPSQDTREQMPQTDHESQIEPQVDQGIETQLDDRQIRSSGGLRYQQAHRQPGDVEGGAPRASAPVAEPDLQQQGEEYGGPAPEDQEVLHEHGYPKLGQKLPSQVTQVEHGPYAGGTQQGDTKPTPES